MIFLEADLFHYKILIIRAILMLTKDEEYSMWDDLQSSDSLLIDSQGNKQWQTTKDTNLYPYPKKTRRTKDTQVSDHNLSYQSQLKAYKNQFIATSQSPQRDIIVRNKQEQKRQMSLQKLQMQELEEKHFKELKKVQNHKAQSIKLENTITESCIISNSNHLFAKTLKNKSISVKKTISKADKSIEQSVQSKKDRFFWSEENELILILLLSLEAFSQTMVTALLPYTMEECQYYLKRNLYRLYNNLVHKATKFSRNLWYFYHYKNPVLIDLFHQYLRKHPRPQDETSVGNSRDLRHFIGEYKPIVFSLKWRELQC